MGYEYIVMTPKSLNKTKRNMPLNAKKMLECLIKDIQNKGPVRTEYHNFSMLGKDKYHCHLAYKWVAVWRCIKDSYFVEVEYVGSREKAPY